MATKLKPGYKLKSGYALKSSKTTPVRTQKEREQELLKVYRTRKV